MELAGDRRKTPYVSLRKAIESTLAPEHALKVQRMPETEVADPELSKVTEARWGQEFRDSAHTVLPVEIPRPDNPALAASRDGRALLFTQGEGLTHISLAEGTP
jgi:hypothetical protein